MRRTRQRERRPAGAREVALQILAATESRRAYSDRLLESRLRESRLSPRDASLVTALVQGTLRHRALLDHHLASFAGERWEGLPLWIRQILRMGALQILVMTRVPPSAAVDESVKLAKKYGHPGTAGLVNALLRRLAGGERAPLPDAAADPVGHLATAHSHPRWLVERWLARYGTEETASLLQADNVEPSVSVRASGGRLTTEALAQALRAEGLTAEPARNGGPVLLVGEGFVAARSPLFREGALSLQDEAEAVVVAILDPRPGEAALDAAAAPGGKASQIAEAVLPGGFVVALERHGSRARALRANLAGRLSFARAWTVAGDAAAPPVRGPFDRVLVDAPCSGLGVLRRRADARWRKDEGAIAEMAALQARLLEGAAPLVRPGGIMVYSVCSLEPEETEAIVIPFLKRHPEFSLEDARPFLPPKFRGDDFFLRATPHKHGTDGVFAARIARR
ncbi:MAG TPA: 16S rRNA (cytosine(967)-C(5))-methyltransferase RsmB [Candidatus Limnocylindrales bacterium]|nr:16S rRNA (cytosine(967)-C(5))-methyltransferase RsmB [Candidatus Limnocylindrales bacterium]